MKDVAVRLLFSSSDSREEIVARSTASGWIVEREGRGVPLDVVSLPDGRVSLIFQDGRQLCGRVLPSEGSVVVHTAAGPRRVRIENPLLRRRAPSDADAGSDQGEEVRALMPGRVIEVAAAEGTAIEPGGLLLVLEAMKMQNEIRASRGGVVLRVAVAAGDVVDGGALLVSIGPPALT